MKKDTAIKVSNVHKSFRLPHEKQSSLKSKLINFKKGKKGYETQHVLEGISFEVKKGEFFGIVGRNGSGKSTLLKILAGIYTPDSGSVQVEGTITPFIELGVGFNPELTGRENVYMNGALMGFSRKEMDAMYAEIVEFAELDRFMDQKLKNYSSGMQVRLAFSIAIKAQGDILILDEVLAVGDSAFQQKCYDHFAKLKKEKKTIILVSHSMSAVERFCSKALLLEEGKIVEVGDSSRIASLYEEMFAADKEKKATGSQVGPVYKDVSVEASIFQNNKKTTSVKTSDGFTISLQIKSKINVEHANVGINIKNSEGQMVFASSTRSLAGRSVKLSAAKPLGVNFEIDNYYTNGSYTLDVAVVEDETVAENILLKKKTILNFKMFGVVRHQHSLFHPPTKLIIKD